VNDQPFLQVRSDTNVILLRMGFASDEIHKLHEREIVGVRLCHYVVLVIIGPDASVEVNCAIARWSQDFGGQPSSQYIGFSIRA
jgi:hypothetical protein